MSYSIVSIVVGTYITKEVDDAIQALNIEDPEDAGFQGLYHGSNDHMCGYCGIELDEFDEACDALAVNKLKLTPTAKQIADAQTMVAALDPTIQAVMPPFGVYLVFHTS